MEEAELGKCGYEYRLVKENENDMSAPAVSRLFHRTTGVMITPENRETYVPDGEIFDDVSQCCQKIAQKTLQDEFDLNWMDLFSYEGNPVWVLASSDLCAGAHPKSPSIPRRPVLIVIPGKGKSRAGVLSVKELLVSGLERGSAYYHVEQATQRGWSVLLLDPNASGKSEGKLLTRKTLDHLHDSWLKHPIYILAHSAAGGYLVQYLLQGDRRHELLSNMERIALTDSTHNIHWAKDNESVRSLLQSERVLYVRNNSEHPSDTFASTKDKEPGEVHEVSDWWKRRFGSMPTVWAGTTHHSAMCWVARDVIWEFFDRDDIPEFEYAPPTTTPKLDTQQDALRSESERVQRRIPGFRHLDSSMDEERLSNASDASNATPPMANHHHDSSPSAGASQPLIDGSAPKKTHLTIDTGGDDGEISVQIISAGVEVSRSTWVMRLFAMLLVVGVVVMSLLFL